MKIELRLLVDYNTDAYDDESEALTDLQEVLHRSVHHMIACGGLSDDTPATVNEYEVHTDRVEE